MCPPEAGGYFLIDVTGDRSADSVILNTPTIRTQKRTSCPGEHSIFHSFKRPSEPGQESPDPGGAQGGADSKPERSKINPAS